jgi:hypothetical protein
MSLNEYMYLDVPKLDVHNFALFCCLLWSLWEQVLDSSFIVENCVHKLVLFWNLVQRLCCFWSDAGQNLRLLWVWYEPVLWRMLQRLILVRHSHIRLLLIGRSDSVAIQIEYWCILCIAFKELALEYASGMNMHPFYVEWMLVNFLVSICP